ncbi:MAG: pitrilysin family protein [Candidatus Krumholzibacteriales bacterium]
MKRFLKFPLLPTILTAIIIVYLSCERPAPEFGVSGEVLDNGLRVLLHEDHSVPVVSYQTFFRAGSRNERRGIRGISQLVEHMMFQGTERYGSGEFDRLLETRGGTANASTSRDMTVYSSEFHRDLLEKVIELEADRMRNLRFMPEDIEKEKKVLAEERLRTVDNSVRGRMREKLFNLAFKEHPYSWPEIGTARDVEALTREDCLEYYRSRYLPANAVIVAAGDFDAAEAMELIRVHYGSIPSGELPEDNIPGEPAQSGERRDTLDVRWRLPVLKIGFRAPPAGSEDIYPLDILQMILDGGRFSRLPSRLVSDLDIAASVSTFFPWRIDPALFIVTVRMREGHDTREGEEAFYSVMEEIVRDGIGDDELAGARKMIEAGYLRGMDPISGRARRIGRYQVLLGDYRKIYEVQRRYRQVKAADVVRVAEKYFRPENSNVVILMEAGSQR